MAGGWVFFFYLEFLCEGRKHQLFRKPLCGYLQLPLRSQAGERGLLASDREGSASPSLEVAMGPSRAPLREVLSEV